MSERDVQILQDLNAGYIRSVRESDTHWFDEHLAPDFLNSNPDGTLVDRQAFLAQIARPIQVSQFDCADVRIRILGGVAIIHAKTTYRKPDGGAAAGRYTDVWARTQERWLCVSAHVTRG